MRHEVRRNGTSDTEAPRLVVLFRVRSKFSIVLMGAESALALGRSPST
jgi:hypothetical protein